LTKPVESNKQGALFPIALLQFFLFFLLGFAGELFMSMRNIYPEMLRRFCPLTRQARFATLSLIDADSTFTVQPAFFDFRRSLEHRSQ
jgi:hypothetical protein